MLPIERAQPQGGVRLVQDVVAVLDARDALVVRVDDRLRGRAVLGRLARGQLLYHGAQYLQAHLRLVAAQILVGRGLLRRQQRHHERGQEQRDHDDAAGQEYDEFPLGEGHHAAQRVEVRHRYGEHHGQRDGALRPAQRHDQRRAHVGAPSRPLALRRAVRVVALHGEQPHEAHRHVDEREQQDVADEHAVVDAHVVPGSLHGLRQLRAQEHEHDAVQRERQHAPHAGRHDVHARDRGPDGARRYDVHQARRHHGNDAARAQLVGHEVHDERREHLEQHVERRVLEAPRAHAPHEEVAQIPQRQADGDAAEEAHDEVERGVKQRERARGGRRKGELERHDARGVVDERLALQNALVARCDVRLLRERRHGNGIGGAERGSQREGGEQADGGLEPFDGEPDDKGGDHHQADGQRQHGPAVLPQRALVHVLGLVEQEGRDEQHEEQVGVERDVDLRGGEQGDEQAQSDLDERGGHFGDKLVDHRGEQDGREHEQCEHECLHRSPSLRCVAFRDAGPKGRPLYCNRPSSGGALQRRGFFMWLRRPCNALRVISPSGLLPYESDAGLDVQRVGHGCRGRQHQVALEVARRIAAGKALGAGGAGSEQRADGRLERIAVVVVGHACVERCYLAANEKVDFRERECLLQRADDHEVGHVVTRVLLAGRRRQHALLHVVVHHRARDDLLVGLVKGCERFLEEAHELVHVQVDAGYLPVAGQVQLEKPLGVGRCADVFHGPCLPVRALFAGRIGGA